MRQSKTRMAKPRLNWPNIEAMTKWRHCSQTLTRLPQRLLLRQLRIRSLDSKQLQTKSMQRRNLLLKRNDRRSFCARVRVCCCLAESKLRTSVVDLHTVELRAFVLCWLIGVSKVQIF